MLKIGYFSRIAQVSVRTLRHYDDIGLLVPAEVDYITGYRNYSVDQLHTINRIVFLKELGFSLSEISKLLKEDLTIDEMSELLRQKSVNLESEIKATQRRLKSLNNRLMMIERDNSIPLYDIKIKEASEVCFVSLRRVVPTVDKMTETVHSLIKKIHSILTENKVEIMGSQISLYYNEDYTNENIDVEVCLPILDSKKNKEIALNNGLKYTVFKKEPKVVSLIYTTEDLADVDSPITEIFRWTILNGHQITGPLREIFLTRDLNKEWQKSGKSAVEFQLPIK